jgi:hypothetical protein
VHVASSCLGWPTNETNTGCKPLLEASRVGRLWTVGGGGGGSIPLNTMMIQRSERTRLGPLSEQSDGLASMDDEAAAMEPWCPF